MHGRGLNDAETHFGKRLALQTDILFKIAP